jgi:hypothetical protein
VKGGEQMEIKVKGYLTQNENGRYEVDGYEFTSGDALEFYCTDFNEWIPARIEHAHKYGGYYIYGYPETPLEGLTVRVKR